MSALHRERYEVPLAQLRDSIFLDVMCHGGKILLVNVLFRETTQAVYYPAPDVQMPCSDAEKACRLALGHFRSRSYNLYPQERRSILRRCVLILDENGPLYDGVLFQHQEENGKATRHRSSSIS
ncbi:hypothetical protein [Pseudomonas sp. F(2018)]|uniref:hypothetical protein n=1 Tax=Pseudomonas sp. F(2018) TaxID=2502240 RepID=UPI0010F48734|nr:hypothetical protein [Pseudomonas sp. F(2018)]